MRMMAKPSLHTCETPHPKASCVQRLTNTCAPASYTSIQSSPPFEKSEQPQAVVGTLRTSRNLAPPHRTPTMTRGTQTMTMTRTTAIDHHSALHPPTRVATTKERIADQPPSTITRMNLAAPMTRRPHRPQHRRQQQTPTSSSPRHHRRRQQTPTSSSPRHPNKPPTPRRPHPPMATTMPIE